MRDVLALAAVGAILALAIAFIEPSRETAEFNLDCPPNRTTPACGY